MLRMLSEINLILQVVILVVLFAGVFQTKRKRFNHHGYLMFFVVALNFLSISLVMGPSAARILIGTSPSTFTLLVAIHSLIGVVSEGLGVFIVLIWRIRRTEGSCYKLKNYMKALTYLWILSIIMGVTIYLLL